MTFGHQMNDSVVLMFFNINSELKFVFVFGDAECFTFQF